VQALMDVLAPDVVLLSDGGGKVSAGLRPILGADKVARFLAGLSNKLAEENLTAEYAVINGRPGALVYLAGKLDTVITIDIEDGIVSRVYMVRNPDKIAGAASPQSLRR
jgi:RNA polymerase sigma-70 factor (ECF subfamily)